MPDQLVRYAHELATQSLSDADLLLSERAAAQAVGAARALDRPRPELLEAAALLHRVGQTVAAAQTGFFPVDGALYLFALGWPTPVVSLVGHQAQARSLAPYLGGAAELALFERVQGWPSDILDFAILTAGAQGQELSIEEGLVIVALEQDVVLDLPLVVRVTRLERLRRAGARVDCRLSVVNALR